MRRATTGAADDPRLLDRTVSIVLGWAALASLITLAILGLWVAPPDAVQGDAQRLMYLHVPAAWLAYLAFGVTALARCSASGPGPARRSGTASPARRPSSA